MRRAGGTNTSMFPAAGIARSARQPGPRVVAGPASARMGSVLAAGDGDRDAQPDQCETTEPADQGEPSRRAGEPVPRGRGDQAPGGVVYDGDGVQEQAENRLL